MSENLNHRASIKNQIIYIDNNQKLSEVVYHLSKPEFKQLAVDFEGDFGRFKYGITLCLVQIFDGERGYIIDPFAVNMQLLKDIFTGEKAKVMFDPSGDFILLKNSHNILMKNVVDVQLAAKLLGFEKLSLTAVLNQCLGIDMPNKKKFQTANWTKRPLNDDLLEYAISDVKYLLTLEEILVEQIKSQGKWEIFLQKNHNYSLRDYTIDHRKKFLKLKHAMKLSRINKIYLRHFFETREKIAKAKDIPSNFILKNELLLRLAQAPPKSISEWLELKDLPKNFSRYVREFTRAKAKADRVVKYTKTSIQGEEKKN